MPRLFHRPRGNSRFAWFLPVSEVIQRVEIAESPVQRAFHGVPLLISRKTPCPEIGEKRAVQPPPGASSI